MSGSHREFVFGPRLGRGGFGEVYRAHMRAPGGLVVDVAVKLLRGELGPDSDAFRRLRDEGHVLARLAHPAIVRVIDFTAIEGRAALVMEHIDGEDLIGCAVGPSPIGPRAALQATGALADALDAAFRARAPGNRPLALVHRDVKPSNIRLGRHGSPKLLDFGIARSDAMPREARTGTGVVVGSLAYMAPERFAAGTVTHESDVFGLGCCLFEVLAVERYYPPHRSREVPALSVDRERFESWRVGRLARLEAIDRPIVELLGRMLAWDPSERPRSSDVVLVCEELADAVRGPTLAAWARARAWPTVEHARGPWTGRVVVDEPMGAGAKSHAR